jgi:beta-galactosidase
MEQLESYYRALFESNVTADFAAPGADLSRYRLVLVPNLYLVSDADAEKLAAFVEAGGVLVMSFFSGIVDTNDHIRLGGYPGAFRTLLGLRVDDFYPLADGETRAISFASGSSARGELWSELIEPEGSGVVATFTDGVLAGRPAVARHHFGRGQAYYLGTRLDPAAMTALLADATRQVGVSPVLDGPPGVEAVRRGALLFLLNHASTPADVEVPGKGVQRLEPLSVSFWPSPLSQAARK